MKKFSKKLTAVIMAAAMSIPCGAMAFAAENESTSPDVLISHVVFNEVKDSSGNLEGIRPGVFMRDYSAAPQEISMIIARYDSKGVLKECLTDTELDGINLTLGTQGFLRYTNEDKEKGDVIKTFIWNKSDIEPKAAVATYDKQPGAGDAKIYVNGAELPGFSWDKEDYTMSLLKKNEDDVWTMSPPDIKVKLMDNSLTCKVVNDFNSAEKTTKIIIEGGTRQETEKRTKITLDNCVITNEEENSSGVPHYVYTKPYTKTFTIKYSDNPTTKDYIMNSQFDTSNAGLSETGIRDVYKAVLNRLAQKTYEVSVGQTKKININAETLQGRKSIIVVKPHDANATNKNVIVNEAGSALTYAEPTDNAYTLNSDGSRGLRSTEKPVAFKSDSAEAEAKDTTLAVYEKAQPIADDWQSGGALSATGRAFDNACIILNEKDCGYNYIVIPANSGGVIKNAKISFTVNQSVDVLIYSSGNPINAVDGDDSSAFTETGSWSESEHAYWRDGNLWIAADRAAYLVANGIIGKGDYTEGKNGADNGARISRTAMETKIKPLWGYRIVQGASAQKNIEGTKLAELDVTQNTIADYLMFWMVESTAGDSSEAAIQNLKSIYTAPGWFPAAFTQARPFDKNISVFCDRPTPSVTEFTVGRIVGYSELLELDKTELIAIPWGENSNRVAGKKEFEFTAGRDIEILYLCGYNGTTIPKPTWIESDGWTEMISRNQSVGLYYWIQGPNITSNGTWSVLAKKARKGEKVEVKVAGNSQPMFVFVRPID